MRNRDSCCIHWLDLAILMCSTSSEMMMKVCQHQLLLHGSVFVFPGFQGKLFWGGGVVECVTIHDFVLINHGNIWPKQELYILVRKLLHLQGSCANTLRPRQNFHHFANYSFKYIYVWNSLNVPMIGTTIFRNWCSHYLNQWRVGYWNIYASHGLNDLKQQNLLVQMWR